MWETHITRKEKEKMKSKEDTLIRKKDNKINQNAVDHIEDISSKHVQLFL